MSESQFAPPTRRSASGPAGVHFHLILFMQTSIKGLRASPTATISFCLHMAVVVFVDGLPVAASICLLLILRGSSEDLLLSSVCQKALKARPPRIEDDVEASQAHSTTGR